MEVHWRLPDKATAPFRELEDDYGATPPTEHFAHVAGPAKTLALQCLAQWRASFASVPPLAFALASLSS